MPNREESHPVSDLAQQFTQLWNENGWPDVARFLNSHPNADSREQLDVLLVDQSERWQRGNPRSLDEYLHLCPTAASNPELKLELIRHEYAYLEQAANLEQFAARFPELREQLLDLLGLDKALPETVEMSLTNPASTMTSPSPTTDSLRALAAGRTLGDYELLGKIAQGGMGVVYKARQLTLNRIVALKMIRAGEHASDSDIKRFRIEAQAAASLDHPNIVPVYEVGEQDSQQYFSMGYVEGQSLQEKLNNGPLAAKEAAEFMKTIGEAVHYAHEKGIVHRDLKPGNVLIDAEGKPRITDFGLAKTTTEDSGMTATGQVIGTPSYMPPEQAEGRAEQIGPLADVYSLGAMLYALLTGRPPFQAANAVATLAQVRESDPISPRSLVPAVDRDLETICLKCLEKEPDRRYTTASNLADDIARHLDGKPIIARPISRANRLWRWCRRNPIAATLVALITMLAVVGPTVAVHQIDTNRRLDKALVRKDKALRGTEGAIDRYVQTVKEAELLNDPRFKDLLKALLEDALAHYDRFIKENKDEQDEATLVRMSQALFEIGYINLQKGSIEESIKAHQRAIGIQERLLREHPKVAYQWALAANHNAVGGAYLATGRTEEALEAHQRALQIRKRFAQEEPDSVGFQRDLAHSYHNVGLVKHAIGEWQESLEAEQLAMEIHQRLARQEPTVEHRTDLATSHTTIGSLYRETRRPADALESYAKALELREHVASEDPTHTASQIALANLHGTIANLHLTTGKPSEALKARQLAIEIHDQLARDQPTVSSFQANLATSHHNMGVDLLATGKPDDAFLSFQEALRIQERLTKDSPTVTDFQNSLALTFNSIGRAYILTLRPNEALAAWQKAVNIQERLVRDNPTVMNYQRDLAGGYHSVGVASTDLGQLGEALSAHQRSLTIRKRLVQQNPDVIQHHRDLAASYTGIGILHSRTGDSVKSLEAYQQAILIYGELMKKFPTVTEFQIGVAGTQSNIGSLYRSEGNSAEATEKWSQAIDLLQAELKRNPRDAQAQQFLRITLTSRANLLGELSRHTEAAVEWRNLKQMFPNDPEAINLLAWFLATCPDESCRDGEEALVLAKTLCEQTGFSFGPFLDTLAAAHAETGDFEKAVEWQQKAVERLPHPLLAGGKARLESYRNEKPYREQPKAAESSEKDNKSRD